MKIMIDTSILIDFSRRTKKKDEKTLWSQLLSKAKKEGHQLILPSICLFEFFSGKEMDNSENIKKADNLLSDVIILDINEEISRKAGELFRKYEFEIGVVDYLLAATALVLDGSLITLNKKHFQNIKGLKFLEL